MARKKQINSLDRFRKQSPHLLLEQHGHCEVPAGCGGVVMRWRNPRAARPVRVWVYTPAPATCWIDGEPLERGSLDLKPGAHVLAVAMEKVDRWEGVLMAALAHDPEDAGTQKAEAPLKIVSSGDGTWKGTLEAPAEGWRTADFADAGWSALVEVAIPDVGYDRPGGWQWYACRNQGAAGLRFDLPRQAPRSGPVWLRKVFDIPAS